MLIPKIKSVKIRVGLFLPIRWGPYLHKFAIVEGGYFRGRVKLKWLFFEIQFSVGYRH